MDTFKKLSTTFSLDAEAYSYGKSIMTIIAGVQGRVAWEKLPPTPTYTHKL
jgi:hypothetical protein